MTISDQGWKAYLAATRHKLLQQWYIVLGLLLLLGVLLTGGLVPVSLEGRASQDRHLAEASQFASVVLPNVNEPMKQATMTARQLSALIAELPGPQLLSTSPSLQTLLEANLAPIPDGMIKTIALLYQGRLLLAYPTPGPELASLLAQLDTLSPAPLFPDSVFEDTVYGMTTGDIIRSDVLTGRTPDGFIPHVRLLPVFANATNVADNWGWPANQTAAECLNGTLPCYNTTANVKWWGQVMVVFNKTALLAPSVQLLEDSGYGYQLTSLQTYPNSTRPADDYLLAANDGWSSCQSPPIVWDLPLSETRKWEVSLCITSGWGVPWKLPVTVMVVVVAVALVALLGLAAQRWHAHSQLIQALLPAQVLNALSVANVRKSGTPAMPLGTPADRLSSLLHLLLEDGRPSAQDVVMLLTAVNQHHDFYTPDGIAETLQQAAGMDAEVAAALMTMTLADDNIFMSPLHGNGNRTLRRLDTGPALARGLSGADEDAQDLLALQDAEGGEFPDLRSVLGHLMGVNPGEGGVKDGISRIGSIAGNREPPSRRSSGIPASKPSQPAMIRKMSASGLNSLLGLTSTDGVERTPSTIGAGPKSRAGSLLMSAGLLDKLEEVLSGVTRLDGTFNAWELSEAAHKRPLSALGYFVFDQAGLLQEFNISPKLLISFLRRIEKGYLDNPYHNRTHAADVLQSVHAILHQGGLRGTYADPLAVMAAYVAAICHDFEHQGVTNDYLVNTRHALATRYNDKSPHENHHLAAAFKILSEPECNFLTCLPPTEFLRLRKLIIDLVLATDMKQHFTIVGHFNSAYRRMGSERPSHNGNNSKANTRTGTQDIENQQGDTRKHHMGSKVAPAPSGAFTVGFTTDFTKSRAGFKLPDDLLTAPTPIDPHEQSLALQVMFKCADLGHVCAEHQNHIQWVHALEEEFFRQGDSEKALGLPVSPLCDRQGQGIAKSQVGFLEVVVLPLLTSFTNRFPGAKPALTAAMKNYDHWKSNSTLLPTVDSGRR